MRGRSRHPVTGTCSAYYAPRRLTSVASPTHVIQDKEQASWQPEVIDEVGIPPPAAVPRGDSRPAPTTRGAGAQAKGDRLERSVVDILERLFLVDGSEDRRLRTELRRQGAGTQYGVDILFRAKAAGHETVCLVECKNYKSRLTVKTVADKILQAEAAFDAEPIDHWILISPHQDPNNELDQLVQRWNQLKRFPFTVQIWSPQSQVRDLFAIEPAIYRGLYGTDPPERRPEETQVIGAFAERLRPPIRLPGKLGAFIADPRSFVELKEAAWLDQVDGQIERFGTDEKGARLSRPLQSEIIDRLFDSPSGSNVALLLAEFGEGKSFFTVSLCLRLQARYLANPRSNMPIPIRLFLRGYRHFDSPIDFMRTQLAQVGLTIDEWPELTRRKVLIILDGLDEMSVRQDPAATRADLDKVGALLEMLEGIPVLVTSRPHFFSSAPDRERFYDRLRRPHVFWMGQPDRRETVANLRTYANTPALAGKLNRIKELYDPIGLAGKVLFLEMIKATLPDLPEDRFDEIVLYETYVDRSLRRKIQLLREASSPVHDSELLDELKVLLEKIAIAIHVSGEGSVDLRQFLAEAGGAAKMLWRASESEELYVGAEEDATARIGGRSLLRRISAQDESGDKGWLVDFFHRSMKEYFTAKALQRSLNSADPFAVTRKLLIHTPLQPEILGFFGLLGKGMDQSSRVLSSLAHSARAGSGQGFLGGGALSLLCAIDGHMAGCEWKSLDLDGALLAGAELEGCDFRGSSLRGADLSRANLADADIRGVDLTDANLSGGGSVVAFSRDSTSHRYLSLTAEAEIGRISVKSDGALIFSAIRTPRLLRSPQRVFLIAEDVILITAQAEFLIVEVGTGVAEEAAYFRVSNDIRAVTILDQSFIGLVIESDGYDEALLCAIESGEVQWRIPVAAGGMAFGWAGNGIVIAYDDELVHYASNKDGRTVVSGLTSGGGDISVGEDGIVFLTDDARVAWLDPSGSLESFTGRLHEGKGTAVIASGAEVLTAGSDGSVVLLRRDSSGELVEISKLERRLRCAGAKVANLRREHERAIFIANGARGSRGRR